MLITPTHYMLLSAALFIIGVAGVMVRRNIIIIFMSIELMLNAVNINLVAFSNQLHSALGQVFAIFVIALPAAEVGSRSPGPSARTGSPWATPIGKVAPERTAGIWYGLTAPCASTLTLIRYVAAPGADDSE